MRYDPKRIAPLGHLDGRISDLDALLPLQIPRGRKRICRTNSS